MATKLKLDSKGIEAVLNGPAVTNKIASLGATVKANVGSPTASGDPIPVTTRMRVASGGRLIGTRPAVDVTLAHVAGLAVEAKRGPLARAAAAAGLPVKSQGRT
jgi:hypothetical protein